MEGLLIGDAPLCALLGTDWGSGPLASGVAWAPASDRDAASVREICPRRWHSRHAFRRPRKRLWFS